MKVRIFNAFLIIIFIISLFLHFCSFIRLNDILNVTILCVTAWVIGMQSFTMEKMAMYQIIPAIDVNMVYDKSEKRTYFWFSNESSLPGFVHLERKKNNEKKVEVYPPLRISPKERAKKTATAFDFSPMKGDKLILYVSIRPCLDKSNIKFEFEKSYRFSGDQWNETSWSFPDKSFPVFPTKL